MALLALVLLPGAHARWVAKTKTPVPWEDDYRSTLQELIDTLLYAIVTGAIATLSLAVIAVAFLGREVDLRLLIDAGPQAFGPERRLEGAVWLLGYLGLALVTAEAVGNGQLLLGARVLLSTLLFPKSDWTRSTVWAWAIEQKARPASPYGRVAAIVELHSGEIYRGVLSQYPVIADDKNKDFVLAEAAGYNKKTSKFGPVRREAMLLLNSRDCRAIAVGPLRRPPGESIEAHARLGRLITLVPWVMVVAIAGFALTGLVVRPEHDLLLRLLEAFSLQVVAWPTLELLRGQVIGREGSASVAQRLWVLTEVSIVVGLTVLVTEFAPALAFSLLVVAGSALSILLVLQGSVIWRAGRRQPAPTAAG